MVNSIIHIDFPTDDIQKARAFYGKLFDWEFNIVSDEYMTFTADNPPSGAFYVVKDLPEPGICPYVWAKDIDKVLDKVIDEGGRIIQNKTEVQTGFQAIFIDPFGNRVGVYSPPKEEKEAKTKEKPKKEKKEKKKK
ncbi:MAG: VOC family protein [Candidatus Helarchaeota archaeon]